MKHGGGRIRLWGWYSRGDERCWVCTRHSVFLDGQKSNILVSSNQSTFFHMLGESPTCLLSNTKRICLFFNVFPSGWTGKLVWIQWMMDALNTGKFLRETCFSLQEIWDWDGGSPSSRTMTLSILLKQHSSGLRVLNVLEWPDLNPIESVVWFIDCGTPAEPFQLEWARAVLPWK